MKPSEKQDDERAESYARFCIYLELGHGRSLTRAYKLAHPDSTSEVVSSCWRQEYKERKWCSRATSFSLSLFREEARRSVVLIMRAHRAFARKTLRAMLSKEPGLRPASWEETQKAFEFLSKLLPPETVHALAMAEEEPPGAMKDADHKPEGYDADSFLKELDESHYAVQDAARHAEAAEEHARRGPKDLPPGMTPEEFLRKTGRHPRETYTEPPAPRPAPASPPPPPKPPA